VIAGRFGQLDLQDNDHDFTIPETIEGFQNMYTLILTISSMINGSVAITSVPGFETESACALAAQEWTHKMVPSGSIDFTLKVGYSAACVSRR